MDYRPGHRAGHIFAHNWGSKREPSKILSLLSIFCIAVRNAIITYQLTLHHLTLSERCAGSPAHRKTPHASITISLTGTDWQARQKPSPETVCSASELTAPSVTFTAQHSHCPARHPRPYGSGVFPQVQQRTCCRRPLHRHP